MREIRCSSCGASVRVNSADEMATCKYCGSTIALESAPSSIAVDNHGNLWVSDVDELKLFGVDGLFPGSFQPGMNIRDMISGDRNQLYGITTENRIVVLDLQTCLENL